ncbi:MAG: MBL fold metallo-hydrolase [Deltaproteobacteria bacterium]|nr:MBL fold metallo-hydrolase [Deltaproteobacteria bacterium]
MARKDPVREIAPDLYLISLDQDIPGFTAFIGSWLYKGENTLLVDPGPAATVPVLWDALKTLGVRNLDAILLTHIHMDHAGGMGDLILRFPDTPVICHHAAIPHLKAPLRLWEGSLKTLGDMARAYGPIRPVPGASLLDAAAFRDFGVTPILTPGHAPHHVSYRVEPYLFAGEAGGVFMAFPDGGFRLRPATPPRFFLETSVKSIESLMTVPHELLCYAHFGATRNSPEMLERHKNQLFLWRDIIAAELRMNPHNQIEDRCMTVLLENDPLLSGEHPMSEAIRRRERTFFHNSIRGFIGYIQDNDMKT